MIKSRIKIGDGDIYDFESLYGFIQIGSDNIFAPPIKEFEQTSYPEEAGVHISPISVDDTFEYKATFLIKANGNVDVANWRIEEFNNDICINDNGVKTFKEITFYNDYKGVKIVGYPKPVQTATEFWRDRSGTLHDVVCVELVIKVVAPAKCNFNLANEEYEAFIAHSEVFYVKRKS